MNTELEEIKLQLNSIFHKKLEDLFHMKINSAHYSEKSIDSFGTLKGSKIFSFDFSGDRSYNDYNDYNDYTFSYEYMYEEEKIFFHFHVRKRYTGFEFEFLIINDDYSREEFDEFFGDFSYEHVKTLGYDVLVFNPSNYSKNPFIKTVFERLCNSGFIDERVFVDHFNDIIGRMSWRADLHYIEDFDAKRDREQALEIAKTAIHGDLIVGDDFHQNSIVVVFKEQVSGLGTGPNGEIVKLKENIQLINTLDLTQFPATYRIIPEFITQDIDYPHHFYSDLLEDGTISQVYLDVRHSDFIQRYEEELSFKNCRYSIDSNYLYIILRENGKCFDTYDLKTGQSIHQEEHQNSQGMSQNSQVVNMGNLGQYQQILPGYVQKEEKEERQKNAETFLLKDYDFQRDQKLALEIANDDFTKHGDLIIGEDIVMNSTAVISKTENGVEVINILIFDKFSNSFNKIPKSVSKYIEFPHIFYSEVLEDGIIQEIDLSEQHTDFILKYTREVDFEKYRYTIDKHYLYVVDHSKLYGLVSTFDLHF